MLCIRVVAPTVGEGESEMGGQTRQICTGCNNRTQTWFPFERLVSSVTSACDRCTAAHYTVMWCVSHWLDWCKHSLCWSVCPVQDMEDEFLHAAESGDLPKVEELLAKGCSANSKNEVKYTHLSVSFRHYQAACFHSVEHNHSNLTSLPAIHAHFMPGL